MIDDGEAGSVENKKDHQYVAMPKSWQARNNVEMNQKLGYNKMEDLANTAAPPTPVKAADSNKQLGPESEDNNYNYDKNR